MKEYDFNMKDQMREDDIDSEWFGLPEGEPIEGKTYRADGWLYRDMPGKVSKEVYNTLISILGENNYVLLCGSEGPNWQRGQFLISPEGMENLKKYVEENPGI